mmetsp:Transcript_20849/g.46852  ORF Transcript_20849/g.46852 Transcript_20849/m.46852 type:complete len:904 (-) Transcript_20849:42-2753(-)
MGSLSRQATPMDISPAWKEPAKDGSIGADGAIQLSTRLWDTSLTMPSRQDATQVDAKDVGTPDEWVKRHEDMLRLTGRHPFNSEPPLYKLQEAGWITPPALHVTRNHGAVPKLDRETHEVQLVNFEMSRTTRFKVEDLVKGSYGPVVSFPVTFICAGNRRMEQNMCKKTVGFNWGAAAVGNSVWTGVRLCDFLSALGITKPSKAHRYLHFDGPVGELPKGETGEYGTSIDIGWALDHERDVLLAFKQNGEWLTPDHGAPLRTLLPGCIGGRMIKWLTKITLSDKPSENHYHFFDNRVLPPHVDAELASEEGWWYKPEYIINHMNLNSAMFEPRHMGILHLNGPRAMKTMKVAGYGYVGGGNKVIRAEISLDGGKTWELTDLTRPEDEIADSRATDKHWCWSWWETEVNVSRLLQCKEICCRIVDSNQTMQPAELTWNVMGMMNNCIFRVKVHPITDSTGHPALWFEHPAVPGAELTGWMTPDAGKHCAHLATEVNPGPRGVAPHRPAAAVWSREKECSVLAKKTEEVASDAPAQATAAGSSASGAQKSISEEEVEKHATEESAWIVVKDKVYDCTSYLNEHPGGASSIMLLAGQDATEDFEAVHSSKAWDLLNNYCIGTLAKKGAAAKQDTKPVAEVDKDCFLNPRKLQQLPLVEKIEVSQDTRIFRFGLPLPTMRLGLPTGMHMFLRAKIDDQVVMRPYTPMTDDETVGHVDLLVKVYFKNVHPKFPDGGKMSQHLESMKIGDTIDVKGPLGEVIYKGNGSFEIHGKPRNFKNVGLIAGGTGLTPCFQVLNAVLRDPADKTQVRLLYANQSPDDILMRDTLERLAKEHPDRFKLWFTVDRLPEGTEWSFDTGFISQEMIQDHLFSAGDDTVTFMCGPPAMQKFACIPNLEKLGHKADAMIAF